MLTLRHSGLSSPAYRDWLDYVIVEDGRGVGRLYEDRNRRPELRWFWSITVYVNPKLGITTAVSKLRSRIRAPAKKQPRSWAVTLIKNRGVFLGYVSRRLNEWQPRSSPRNPSRSASGSASG
jgi:hypothetical protein